MAIKIKKNESINLTKASDKLNKVKVELGWETPVNVFPKWDLDVSGFLLGNDGKLLSEEGVVFYNSPEFVINGETVNACPDLSVWKSPDNTSGGTEELYIDIAKLSPAVAEISIIVSIHNAIQRKQFFNQVKKSYLKIYNMETNELIAEFHLDEIQPEKATSIQIGSFFSKDDGFIFQGLGVGYELEFEAFVIGYGAQVE